MIQNRDTNLYDLCAQRPYLKAPGKIRTVRAVNADRDRKKPCVCVGTPGLTPEEPFANHKAVIKTASVSVLPWLLFGVGHHQALAELTGMFIWAGP